MSATPTRSNWDDDPPMLELELDPTPEAPSLARAAIVGFCQDCGVPSSALAPVMLLVSEIVTNAVIHPDVQPPASIHMRARLGPEVIRVEIRDQGSGFTPRPREPSRLQGGYGLYLLDKEALRWGVRQHEGNTVWFELDSGASQGVRSRHAQRPERSPQSPAAVGCRHGGPARAAARDSRDHRVAGAAGYSLSSRSLRMPRCRGLSTKTPGVTLRLAKVASHSRTCTWISTRSSDE